MMVIAYGTGLPHTGTCGLHRRLFISFSTIYIYIYIAHEPPLVGVLVKKAVSRSQLYMPQVRFSKLRL